MQGQAVWLRTPLAHRNGSLENTYSERYFVMSVNSLSSARSVPKDHLMWRVVDYVNANPAEVLTRSDVATKFDADPSTIDSLLRLGVAAGMLKRDDGTADGTVWRHPGKKASAFPRPFTPSLTAATRAQRATRAAAHRLDFEAIEIESDIPVLEKGKTGGEWKALFDRMKPGDSFQLPTRSAAAAANAKLHYCRQVEGARFVLRKVSGSHTRVWRVA